ncbi:hypothetical protein CEP51_006829 [Fusarium floridanum]|uniref:Uncharacterized protein n=1 Tax=Fusarium floridanum TaxID=1325733 RepID=A0A428RRA3_9HYPO|nr:hypothetical protein CEP51_006829 [Fusarium floridanum]
MSKDPADATGQQKQHRITVLDDTRSSRGTAAADGQTRSLAADALELKLELLPECDKV